MDKYAREKYCRDVAQLLINYDVPFDDAYITYNKVEKEERIGLFKKRKYMETVRETGKNYWTVLEKHEEDDREHRVDHMYHLLTLCEDGNVYKYYYEHMWMKEELREYQFEDVELTKIDPDDNDISMIKAYLESKGIHMPATKPTEREYGKEIGAKEEKNQIAHANNSEGEFYYGSDQPGKGSNSDNRIVKETGQKSKRPVEKQEAKPIIKSEYKVNVPDINRTTENKAKLEQGKTNQNVQAEKISDEVIQLKHYAEQGDPKAQYQLAFHYNVGKGVKQDKTEAFRWYNTASENGNTDAMCILASAYMHGEMGCEKDIQMAFDLYESAETNGNKNGTRGLGKIGLVLGNMYYTGDDGVEQDYQKAFQWYEYSAEKGNAEAQCSVAIMYEHGDGVVQDIKKAVDWYITASNNGDKDARQRLTDLKKRVNRSS